jgi:DNA-binding transcriptional LysR family regulator
MQSYYNTVLAIYFYNLPNTNDRIFLSNCAWIVYTESKTRFGTYRPPGGREQRMDLHKLRIFVTVARTGHFTRAADLLHMSQPTVSQQIALLEAAIGTVLIRRQPRRLQLTAAGEALLPYAEQLLALADEATEAARVAAVLSDRTLRLGVGHIMATYLLPDLLRRYQTRYPAHRVRITIGNTSELLDGVALEAVELALIGLPAQRAGVQITPFMHDRLMVIVAPGDTWAEQAAIAPEDLKSRPLLVREPGSALYASVEQLLGPLGLGGPGVIVLGETEAIKRSVEAGLGVALVPEIAVEREVAAGRLVALPLATPSAQRTYAYARLARRRLSRAADDLINLLPRELKQP